MEVKLKVLGGTHGGQIIKVNQSKFFIGRAEDCHLRPRSELIGRFHCALILGKTFTTIRDFGSKNGTFVNGHRVDGEQKLKAGDEILIGPLKFELLFELPAKAKDMKEDAPGTASAGSDVDLNVSQWLADDEDADDETIIQGGGSLGSGMDDPQPTMIAKKGLLPDEDSKESTSGSEKEVINKANQNKASKEHAQPGKLPQVPEKKAKDSGEAAAKMLRKLKLRDRK